MFRCAIQREFLKICYQDAEDKLPGIQRSFNFIYHICYNPIIRIRLPTWCKIVTNLSFNMKKPERYSGSHIEEDNQKGENNHIEASNENMDRRLKVRVYWKQTLYPTKVGVGPVYNPTHPKPHLWDHTSYTVVDRRLKFTKWGQWWQTEADALRKIETWRETITHLFLFLFFFHVTISSIIIFFPWFFHFSAANDLLI